MNAVRSDILSRLLGLMLMAALVMVSGVSGLKAAAQGSPVTSEEKLRRAEETADRFLARFNETLDFGVPYREMYLPDLSWLSKAKKPVPPKLRRFDKLGEQMEVAMMNLWYLRAAYIFTHDGSSLPPEIKAARGEELFPYLTDLNYINKKPLSVQRRKWQNYLNSTKRLADLYRRYLPPGVFASSAYQARVEEVDREMAGDKSRSRVEKGFNNYKELENRDVYKVLRGGIEYTLIEENGAFKVIHINPLPGFRLSP